MQALIQLGAPPPANCDRYEQILIKIIDLPPPSLPSYKKYFLVPSKETLARDKKVAFRLMARIADVIEGRTDGLRERTTGYTMKEICGREVSQRKKST